MSKPNICTSTTKAGHPCTAPATREGKCYFHAHPEQVVELGRQGGLTKAQGPDLDDFEMPPLNTAEDIRAFLAKVAADLRTEKIQPRVATSLTQLASGLLKAIEVSDLEKRLRKLEGGKNDGPEEKN